MPDNKLQSLSDIFSERFFRIPDFQRGFSWEEQQLQDFWDDLETLQTDRVHYTGLLTVERLNKNEVQNKETWQDDLWLIDAGFKSYYLIDGQQRVTTSIILIHELLRHISDEKEIKNRPKTEWINKFLYRNRKNSYQSFIFGYEKDNPSDEYFKTRILGQHSASADKVPEQTLYTFNLQFAKDFFEEKLRKMQEIELENTFSKLVEKFKYNFYEIDDELDVYITFETMNNRGKPLSSLELLKNRLIYLTTLDVDSEDTRRQLRKDINETWKTIYAFLGKNKERRLDDDEFLFNHWIMYFTYNRKESAAYAKFLLNEKFTAQNLYSREISFEEIKNYIKSLAEGVKSYYYLHNIQDSAYNDEIKYWAQRLRRLSFAAFRPLLMAALNKEENQSLIAELFQKCERFVFLVFRLSNRKTNTKNSHFYRLASEYYHGRPWSNQDQQATSINHLIANVDSMTDRKSDENDSEEGQGWYDLDRFYDYVSDLFSKENGFYDWNAIKYFLYEYEEYKREEASGDIKRSWENFAEAKKDQSIEHILPQKPDDPSWKEALDGLTPKQIHHCTHSLGNLLLLARNKNAEQGNRPFKFKKKHKNNKGKEVGYFNGSYSEIEVSQYPDDWRPAEILERGIRMLQFLEQHWDVKLTDERDKTYKKLLHLEFIP